LFTRERCPIQVPVIDTRAERHARGFTSWDPGTAVSGAVERFADTANRQAERIHWSASFFRSVIFGD